MELFPEEIEKELQAQFHKGADLDQMVIVKIFDPYGSWQWYIMNQDPNDPDYLWGIVNGFEVEMGSVSKKELEAMRVTQFKFSLERDEHFTPVSAQEVWDTLNREQANISAENNQVPKEAEQEKARDEELRQSRQASQQMQEKGHDQPER